MRYCNACRNLMLVKSSQDARTGEYACPACGNREPLGKGTHVLRERQPADDSAEYARYLTPLLGMDPALPRARGLRCTKCSAEDIIFVKYNAPGMRYLYHCGSCKEFWKGGQASVKADGAQAPLEADGA